MGAGRPRGGYDSEDPLTPLLLEHRAPAATASTGRRIAKGGPADAEISSAVACPGSETLGVRARAHADIHESP
jgi:hypothetical protein